MIWMNFVSCRLNSFTVKSPKRLSLAKEYRHELKNWNLASKRLFKLNFPVSLLNLQNLIYQLPLRLYLHHPIPPLPQRKQIPISAR